MCVDIIFGFFPARLMESFSFENKDGGWLELFHKLRHSVTLRKIICTMTEYDYAIYKLKILKPIFDYCLYHAILFAFKLLSPPLNFRTIEEA